VSTQETIEEIDLPGSSNTMIEMIKVSRTYVPNITALANISFSVATGEMFFLIGRSGAGKTTLLKLICNMEMPSNGLIEVAEANAEERKRAAMMAVNQ
jgi:cell division transport system ATP-binding protein